MNEPSPITAAEVAAFIAESAWTFAKTMPETPHEYTLLKNARSEETFRRVVRYIFLAGYDDLFFTTTYRYLDVDGWQYWVCQSEETQTGATLINRARHNRADRPHRLAPQG